MVNFYFIKNKRRRDKSPNFWVDTSFSVCLFTYLILLFAHITHHRLIVYSTSLKKTFYNLCMLYLFCSGLGFGVAGLPFPLAVSLLSLIFSSLLHPLFYLPTYLFISSHISSIPFDAYRRTHTGPNISRDGFSKREKQYNKRYSQ